MEEMAKKDQAIYLPPQICFPVSTSSSQFENCWPQWHAPDLTEHITGKGWEHGMELPPLWKRHCSKKPLTILTEMQVFPEKENSFVTKATVPLFCLHYKQAPKMACVTQTFPKQSTLLQYTCDSMCCRLTCNKHRICQEGILWGTSLTWASQTASGHELCLGSLRSFLWLLKKATKVGTVHSNLQNCMFSLATLSHLVHKICLQS